MSPRTMVQADRHGPSMMTVSPEVRRAANLSIYLPIWPPRSPAIRTAALLACTPANTRAAAKKNLAKFISYTSLSDLMDQMKRNACQGALGALPKIKFREIGQGSPVHAGGFLSAAATGAVRSATNARVGS